MIDPVRASSRVFRGVFGAVVLFLNCAPVVTTKSVVEQTPEPEMAAVAIERGDTVTYRCAFTDKAERERFIYSFERFIREHSFLVERYDSGGCFVAIKILPFRQPDEASPPQQPTRPLSDTLSNTIEDEVPWIDTTMPAESDSALQPAHDTVVPASGGSLKVYLPRAEIDYPFSTLVEAIPYLEKDSIRSGYLTMESVSPTIIEAKLAPKIVNATGQVMTVLDIIERWTRFIKDHPAEGLALFRTCEGIMEFINGREAVMRGFQAVDGRTIRIKLSRADSSAIDRLATSRVLPSSFKLGNYYIKTTKDNEDILAANNFYSVERPLLATCLLRRGGDGNPIVSFSLGRYDAVLLSGSGDLDYVRRNLLKNGATCSFIGRDRYFISCAVRDSLMRAYIRGLLSSADLLKNSVKVEGSPIARLESDSAPPPSPSFITRKKPAHPEPVTILFRKDDAVSKTLAAKLLADFANAGIQSTLLAADRKAYESALIGRSYGCAVGWTSEAVLYDKSEKLRAATIFFNDETNEDLRIQNNREIPLFSVDWYLLAKAGIGLYKGKASGLYMKP